MLDVADILKYPTAIVLKTDYKRFVQYLQGILSKEL